MIHSSKGKAAARSFRIRIRGFRAAQDVWRNAFSSDVRTHMCESERVLEAATRVDATLAGYDSSAKTWTVDRIVSKKKSGRAPSRMRWEGWAKEHDTWEPAANLPAFVLDEFRKGLSRPARKGGKVRKAIGKRATRIPYVLQAATVTPEECGCAPTEARGGAERALARQQQQRDRGASRRRRAAEPPRRNPAARVHTARRAPRQSFGGTALVQWHCISSWPASASRKSVGPHAIARRARTPQNHRRWRPQPPEVAMPGVKGAKGRSAATTGCFATSCDSLYGISTP